MILLDVISATDYVINTQPQEAIIPLVVMAVAAIVISAASAASQAAAQKKAQKAQQKAEADRQRKIDAKAAEENAFYRMEYYKDPMRTAEGANALRAVREYNNRLTEIQKNRNVITGGTHEQTIAQQAKAMKAYSDAVSNIRADSEKAKRYIGQNWLKAQDNQFNRQLALDDQKHATEMQSYQNTVNNINNFANTAQTALSSFSSMPNLGSPKAPDMTSVTAKNKEYIKGVDQVMKADLDKQWNKTLTDMLGKPKQMPN